MRSSAYDWVLVSARSLGPLLAVGAFLLAMRGDLGVGGGAAGGVLLAIVGCLHMLTSGVAASRRAAPPWLLTTLIALGVGLGAAGWIGPVLAQIVGQTQGLITLIVAPQVTGGLMTAGVMLASAGGLHLAVLSFVSRAPDLSEEAW